MTSDTAILSVIKDTVSAEVVSVAAKSTNKLLVKFNEGLDATSGAVAGNYALSDGVSVSGGVVSGSSVVLDTSDMTPDATYTLTVQNVQDLYGNAIGSSSVTFKVRIVTYGEVIQSDGPIAYYRFEETSGMVAKNLAPWVSRPMVCGCPVMERPIPLRWKPIAVLGLVQGMGFLALGMKIMQPPLTVIWISSGSKPRGSGSTS